MPPVLSDGRKDRAMQTILGANGVIARELAGRCAPIPTVSGW
jgi:hypothetical protein